MSKAAATKSDPAEERPVGDSLLQAKGRLSMQQLMLFESEMERNARNAIVGWLFLIFGGVFGLHKFYLGRWGWGLLYLFTAGILTIGWWVDLFTLHRQIRAVNDQIALGILREIEALELPAA